MTATATRPTRVLMEGSRGAGAGRDRGRLPVLRRLPDDAVHRAARALRPAAARGRRRVHQRRARARGRRHGVGRARHRRPRRDRLDRPGPVAHAGVVLRDHARRAAARRSSTWPAASRTTTRRPAAAGTATTATSCSRRRTSREGVELVQLAFHLADKWRNPVLVYGDYLLAHTQEAVDDRADRRSPTLPAKDWAVDGSRRRHRAVASRSRRSASARTASPRSARRARRSTSRRRSPLMEREVRVETGYLDDAETVIVAFGSPAKFVKYAIEQLRADGRPHRLRAADHAVAVPVRRGARRGRAARARVGVVRAVRRPDDRRRAHRRRRAGAGRRSSAASRPTTPASASGRLLDVEVIRERILALHTRRADAARSPATRVSYELQPHQEQASR